MLRQLPTVTIPHIMKMYGQDAEEVAQAEDIKIYDIMTESQNDHSATMSLEVSAMDRETEKRSRDLYLRLTFTTQELPDNQRV